MTPEPIPVDPEVLAVLRTVPGEILAIGLKPAEIISMRKEIAKARLSDDDLRCGGTVRIEEASIPSSTHGINMRALVLRPTAGTGPWRGVYAIHGGGMIAGDDRTDIESMIEWVRDIGVVLVSVDYRLAPENRYPAGVEDCYAGLTWMAENAATLGIISEPIAVAGVSAGGGLAAAVTLMARDRCGPAVSCQMLICPMLDDRNVTTSSAYAGIPWDCISNLTAWTALLGDDSRSAAVSQYAAPARAADLRGLPPAFLGVGAIDVFRDETIEYAARLLSSGVPTELHVWSGGVHCFDLLAPQAEVSLTARQAQASFLRRSLRI